MGGYKLVGWGGATQSQVRRMKGGTPLVPGLTDRVTGGGGWPESV